MDSAAAVIQTIFRTHSAGKLEQQAEAHHYAESIRNRARERGEQVRLRTGTIVRLQAKLRGKAARARANLLRDAAQRAIYQDYAEEVQERGPAVAHGQATSLHQDRLKAGKQQVAM